MEKSKGEIEALHGDSMTMRSRLDTNDCKEEKKIGLDEVALKLKYGCEGELKRGALRLSELIEEKSVGSDWIEDEGVIPALFARLISSDHRLIVIPLLKALALDNPINKEKMGEVAFLSAVVRSLEAEEEEERRQTAELLLILSELPFIRRRIGRIKGCISVLVSSLDASDDARKLLDCLSGNIQNALQMAEAGYFKPIVHHLAKGSDMSKILMATALSRMKLTDQNKISLGEDGAIKPLAKLFAAGKLEAKSSALNALRSLSCSPENARRLARSGILASLLQLLFSVTSSLTALREPASAVLAQISVSGSEAISLVPGIAQQMISLLSLSSPAVRAHLFRALNGLVSNTENLRIRMKMKEDSVARLVLPFLAETNNLEVRARALGFLVTLCRDMSEEELSEMIGEEDIAKLVGIVAALKSDDEEKADSLAILSRLPSSGEIFKRENLLHGVISTLAGVARSEAVVARLEEGAAGVLFRLTSPSDRKLQLYSIENAAVTILVKLLTSESNPAKTLAAASLGQLSLSSPPVKNLAAMNGWFCGVQASPVNGQCGVHGKTCSSKGGFCLVRSGAVPGLVGIGDEAALGAFATLLRDEILEAGSAYVAKTPGFLGAVLKALGPGTATGAREKALWILERVFRVEEHRIEHRESARALLIDLAQEGNPRLKPMVAKVLAQLELM